MEKEPAGGGQARVLEVPHGIPKYSILRNLFFLGIN
jgi:hypothetical protein